MNAHAHREVAIPQNCIHDGSMDLKSRIAVCKRLSWCFVALFVLASTTYFCRWCAHHQFRGEVFRGTIEAPGPVDDHQKATDIAEIIMRHPSLFSRRDFELPEGWSPPVDWKAPDGFNPPKWWPE